ncbi:MAG: hypothetical protein ACXWC7_09655 [Chitinophagaceae bacterium]
MKQILIASNVILAMTTLFLACNQSTSSTSTEQTNNCDIVSLQYVHPEGRIYADMAKMISELYKADNAKHYVSLNNRQSKYEDALSINFKLTTIKKFIWEIESRRCHKACTDSLGIRFYYAKYPAADHLFWGRFGPLTKEVNANRHTLFAVPTYRTGNGMYVDYDAAHGCREPFSFGQGAKPTSSFLLPDMDSDGIESDAQNHGGLMPPPAGKGTFPTNP